MADEIAIPTSLIAIRPSDVRLLSNNVRNTAMSNSNSLQMLFQRMAAFGDVRFDQAWQLEKLLGSQNVHTEHLLPGERHPIRESLYYALVLLERACPDDVARSQQILEKVSALQGDCPGHPRDGLWHYYAEESVMDWPFPDFNWADFNGMTLLMIWHLKRHLLDQATRDRLREMIRRAAWCVQRRNVAMSYTNIAIKGTFVTLAAAELLGDAALMDYASERAYRLHNEVFRTGTFAEYNSPTYAAVSLAGLMAIDAFVQHESSKKLALDIQHLFWRHIASHFHVPTAELAGPHSRAYSVRLRDKPSVMGMMLSKAMGGSVELDTLGDSTEVGFEPFHCYFLESDVPPDALQLLLDRERVATVEEMTDPRDTASAWFRPVSAPVTRDGARSVPSPIPTRITTYLHPAFCLGSVNLMDGWEQRQNLIAYWNNGGLKPSYLRHRYLHDERPCCSGYFASAQREGCVLAASFLVQYCDHHVSVPAEEISAEFLGTVLDIDNAGETFALMVDDRPVTPNSVTDWQPGEHLWLRLSTVWLAFRLLRHEAVPTSHNTTAKLNFNGSWLDARLPHYRCPRTRMRWTDIESTHTSYALWMAPPQPDWEQWKRDIQHESASVKAVSDDAIDVMLNDLHLRVPCRTIPREALPLALLGTKPF